jgi:transposase-like protein
MCKECGKTYTIDPKLNNAYPEETRKLALKMYFSGVNARGVGHILGFSKSNIDNWKKNKIFSG